jgi:Ca-activated chloride channel family protein
MTFGEPIWLYALAVPPVLAILFFANERRAKLLLQKIVAARLMPQLAGNISHGKRRLRFFILLLGMASFIVSLARPQIGYTWEQSKRKGRDVLIVIDTSKSMLATDLAPNRLMREKLAAQDLIALLPGDRVGVLAFAGASFLQAPLTIDYGAVLDSIQELDTNIIPRGGTDIAGAIEAAAKAFGKGESENCALVLFTDGDELDADGVAAARNHAKDFRIFTVGLGSPDGAIIPVPGDDGGTSFVKDPDGKIVKTKLDENRLRQIADAAGGFYTHLQNGPADMKRIVQDGLGKMRERDIDTRMSRQPIERYQWPLGLGLALVAASMLIGERRRNENQNTAFSKAVLVLILLTSIQSTMQAEWNFFGWRPGSESWNPGVEKYNQARKDKENYSGKATTEDEYERYKNDFDRINGTFKEAHEIFKKQQQRQPDSPEANYNLGTTAFELGDFDGALNSFSKATLGNKPDLLRDAEMNIGHTLFRRGEKTLKSGDEKSTLKDWRDAVAHYNSALHVAPDSEKIKKCRDFVLSEIKKLEEKPPQKKQDEQKDSKQDKNKDKDQKQDQQKQQDKQNKDEKNSDKDKQQQDQSGSQDQKKDDAMSGKDSQKDQQKQSSQQDSKKDDSQQNKDSSQSGNDGQKQDSDKKDQPKQGDPQQPQTGQNQNSSDPQQNKNQPSDQPTPAPAEDKKFSGDIKDKSDGKSDETQNAPQAEPYVPGQERAMSADEAQRVIESAKDEDAKGVLIERKGSAPVLKDW